MWRFIYVHSVKDGPFYSPTGSWKWNNPIFHLVDICQPSHSKTVNIYITACIVLNAHKHYAFIFLSLILERHPDNKRRYRRQINSLPMLGNVVQYHDTCKKVDIFNFVVKGERSYFSTFSFLFSFDKSTLNRYKFKISVETVMLFQCPKQFWLLQLPTSYCVIIINYGYHYRTHFQ